MYGIPLRVLATLLMFCLCSSPRARAGEETWEPPEPPRLGQGFSRHGGPDRERPYWRKNLFKRVAVDQKFLITTWWPAEARRVGFSVPVGLAIAGASRTGNDPGSMDARFARTIEGWSNGRRRETAEFFTTLGDAETAVVLLGGTYLVSRWTGNRRMQRATSLSAEALINSTIYVSVLKRVSRRTRPAGGGTGAFFVSDPLPGQDATSFPSGHATGAFALAAVFAGEFRDRRWVAWVSYGAAGLVAVSRVSLGRHFPSDVIAGAVLGQSIGAMVVHRAGDVDRRPRPMWQRLQPYVDPDSGGLGLLYRHSW